MINPIKDIRMTDTIRLVIAAIFAVFLALAWTHYQQSMTELEGLREYKASVDQRNDVSAAGQASYQDQRADADKQQSENQAHRIIIETKTQEVAHEDPATADFLTMPIPQRLRDADHEARIQRGLEPGH